MGINIWKEKNLKIFSFNQWYSNMLIFYKKNDVLKLSDKIN